MPYVPYKGLTQEEINIVSQPPMPVDNRGFGERVKDDFVSRVETMLNANKGNQGMGDFKAAEENPNYILNTLPGADPYYGHGVEGQQFLDSNVPTNAPQISANIAATGQRYIDTAKQDLAAVERANENAAANSTLPYLPNADPWYGHDQSNIPYMYPNIRTREQDQAAFQAVKDIIGTPAGNIAITPFIPAPVRTIAGAAFTPFLVRDIADAYDRNNTASLRTLKGDTGINQDPSNFQALGSTVNETMIEPILNPLKQAATHPIDFAQGIAEDPTKLWSDVFLPGAVVHGGAKGLKDYFIAKVENKLREKMNTNQQVSSEELNPDAITKQAVDQISNEIEYSKINDSNMWNKSEKDTMQYNTDDSVLDKPPVNMTSIRGDEIPASSDFKQARKDVQDWSKQNIRGGYTNEDTGWNINVARKAIEHTVGNAKDFNQMQSIYALPELIKKAVKIDSRVNLPYTPDITGVHSFYAPLKIGDKPYIAKLVVKDVVTKEGEVKRFYDHQASKIEPDVVLGEPRVNSLGIAPPLGSNTMNIRDLLQYVKDEHKPPSMRNTKETTGANGKVYDSPNATTPGSTRFQPEGAEVSIDNNIQQPNKLFNGKEFSRTNPPNQGGFSMPEYSREDLVHRAYEAARNQDYETAYRYAQESGESGLIDAFRVLRNRDSGQAPNPPKLGGNVKGEYTGDNITKKQILDRIDDIIAPVRTGRMGERGVEGFINYKTGVIRSKNHGDLNVISHEVGHWVDAALGLRKNAGVFDREFTQAVHGRFGAEAYEPGQVRAEGIAEFMKDYVSNPNEARRSFPKYYSAFEDALAKNEDVRVRVNEYKDMMRVWNEQSPEARGRSAVSQAGEREKTFTEKVEDAWFQVQEKIYDSKVGLAKFSAEIQKITGKKLAVEEDSYKMARLANSGVARAQMLVDGVGGKDPRMIQEALNKSYGGVIQHAVTMKSILSKLDGLSNLYPDYLKKGNFKDWNEGLDTLLVARRQVELQNHHPEYKGPMSKADAEYIIRNAPEELHKAAQECYKYNDNILRILAHEGMIKQEVYDALTNKYKNYVSMSREFADEAAIEKGLGMGKGYGNVRSALKSISEEGSSRQVISPLESMIKNTYAMLDMVERNRVGKIFAEKAGEHGVGKLVEEVAGTSSTKDSTFSVWENGEKHTFRTTPELYRAIMSMNQESANFITKIMSVPAGWLRAGATLTPDFALKNLSRDTFSALVFTRNGFIPVVDHLRGLASLIGKDEIYHEYRSSGALASTLTGLDRNYTYASIEKLMKGEGWKQYTPIELMRGFSEAVETMTRLGEYKKARGKGKSMAEAALSARDVTLDFSKSGTWGKKYNQITPFFNAAVQEPARIIQAFKENPVSTSAKIAMFITTPSVLLWAMNHDQEWYKELPQYQKDLFWVFKAGDTVCRVPKPFGLGVLFGSGTERMLDYMYSEDPKHMTRWGKTMFDSFTPNIIPTVFTPLLEWNSNYSNFLERNIVPQKELELHDKMQYGPDTSSLAKFIGEKANMSPRKIDHTMQSLGGGMARQSLNLMDAAIGTREFKNPFTTAFTVDPTKSPQSLQDFYDELTIAKKNHNTSKSTKKDLTGNEKSNYEKLMSANEGMQYFNKQEREVLQSNLSPAQKQAKVAEINKKQMQLAQAVLKNLKR